MFIYKMTNQYCFMMKLADYVGQRSMFHIFKGLVFVFYIVILNNLFNFSSDFIFCI